MATNPNSTIYTAQLVQLVRLLREDDVTADNPQLHALLQTAFAIVLKGSVVQRASQIDIDLPDLEDNVQVDIVQDNIKAVSALYFAAQLEELKFFAVADKVAEQFETGVVPLIRGNGGDAIYRHIRGAVNRLTEAERRGIYARAFGFAQGSVDEPMPNREFADLWIRFLSAVSVLVREARSTLRQSLTDQQVYKNARDLAVNISLHGYGIAHFAAVELQDLMKSIIKMLSYPDVLAAYGVNDIWQLVERVSGLYLGGAVNSVRQRTLASAGSKIIGWIADRASMLSNPAVNRIPLTQTSPTDPVVDPLETALTANIERWLAVTGTDDQSTSKFSEPVSVAQQPTIPNLSLQGLPESLQSIVPRVSNGNLQGAFAQLPNIAPGVMPKA